MNLAVYLDEVEDNLHSLVHLVDAAAFVGAVEVATAGTEVRAGETVVRKAGAVGAAADRYVNRVKAGLFKGEAGVLD